MQDRAADNRVVNDYLWGLNLGGGIGGLLNLKQGGQSYQYLYDGIGNITALLDANQQIAAAYRYDAFGKLLARSGALDQPFQFSTKRYDAGNGLNYFGYRFYSPAIGRWMNRDPLGDEGGINLYGFVLNNPVNWVDPWGLQVANVNKWIKKLKACNACKEAIEHNGGDETEALLRCRKCCKLLMPRNIFSVTPCEQACVQLWNDQNSK